MGGTKVKNTVQPMGEVLADFRQELPGLLQVIAQEIPAFDQAQIDTARQIDPQRAQLQQDLFDVFGRELNRIGGEIQTANALQRVTGEADILGGEGQRLAQAARDAQAILDPEAAAVRAQTGAAIGDLLSSAQGGLSGGERAEIERELNRAEVGRGRTGTPTATSTVQRASNFGGAARSKLSQAIQQATMALPALASGESAFTQVTGRGGTGFNPGQSQFIPTQTPGQEALGISSQLLGGTMAGRGQTQSQSGGFGSAFTSALGQGLGSQLA